MLGDLDVELMILPTERPQTCRRGRPYRVTPLVVRWRPGDSRGVVDGLTPRMGATDRMLDLCRRQWVEVCEVSLNSNAFHAGVSHPALLVRRKGVPTLGGALR